MRIASTILLLASFAATTQVALGSDAEDRGRLSLAWDAHESGVCEETLGYADEIGPESASFAEAVWLKADCLCTLGRYEEAASLLETPAGRRAKDWSNLLERVFEEWAWEATSREDYQGALDIVGRGLMALPKNSRFVALREAAAFRRGLRLAWRGRQADVAVPLPGGEAAVFTRGGSRPRGEGWIQVYPYPWKGSTPWVPEAAIEEWMPSLAESLRREGRRLWIRIPKGSLSRALAVTAGRKDVGLRGSGADLSLVRGREAVPWDPAEWSFRAASEGLGVRGAAAAAVSRAVLTLERRKALSEWVLVHRGPLDVERKGPGLVLRHPATGRSYGLDLDSWSCLDTRAKEWTDFWGDLVSELGRPPTAFRCFCGREAVIREALVTKPGDAVVMEKGKGYALVAAALCPLHQQYVTAELLRAWGVDLQRLWNRAKSDATAKTWDLFFERGEEAGAPYVALQGDGISSLVRRPDLLLGALEAVEGVSVRGASVQVFAPTASSVVVVAAEVPAAKGLAAANRTLLRGARRGDSLDRLGFRATLKLPIQASGTFEVRSVSGP